MKNAGLLFSIIVLGLLSQQAQAARNHRATKEVRRQTPHVAQSRFFVGTKNGAVEVNRDPAVTEVRIRARITCGGHTQAEADERLTEARLNVTRTEQGDLRVQSSFPRPSRAGDGASIWVRLSDTGGGLVRTCNGYVATTGLSGPTRLHTCNGAVRVAGHDGELRITTSNGAVQTTNTRGPLDAGTRNGRVVARDVRGPATLRCTNGSVTLGLAADQEGPVRARTVNGSIDVAVGTSFRGLVSLRTMNGRVHVDDRAHRVTARRMRRAGGSIRVGQGGQPSSLSATNGSVRMTIQ